AGIFVLRPKDSPRRAAREAERAGLCIKAEIASCGKRFGNLPDLRCVKFPRPHEPHLRVVSNRSVVRRDSTWAGVKYATWAPVCQCRAPPGGVVPYWKWARVGDDGRSSM